MLEEPVDDQPILTSSATCSLCGVKTIRRLPYAPSLTRDEWQALWVALAKQTCLGALRHAQEAHGVLPEGARLADFYKDLTL